MVFDRAITSPRQKLNFKVSEEKMCLFLERCRAWMEYKGYLSPHEANHDGVND